MVLTRHALHFRPSNWANGWTRRAASWPCPVCHKRLDDGRPPVGADVPDVTLVTGHDWGRGELSPSIAHHAHADQARALTRPGPGRQRPAKLEGPMRVAWRPSTLRCRASSSKDQEEAVDSSDGGADSASWPSSSSSSSDSSTSD